MPVGITEKARPVSNQSHNFNRINLCHIINNYNKIYTHIINIDAPGKVDWHPLSLEFMPQDVGISCVNDETNHELLPCKTWQLPL